MQPIGKREIMKLSDYVESDLELYLSGFNVRNKDKTRIIKLAEDEVKKNFDNNFFLDEDYAMKGASTSAIEIADREIKKIDNEKLNNKKVIKKMLLFTIAFITYLYIGAEQDIVSIFGYMSIIIVFPLFFVIIFDKEKWYNDFFKFVVSLKLRIALCILILIAALVLI